MKKNIIFLDSSTFPNHLKFSKVKFPHTWKNYKTTSPEEVINRIKDAHIIVNNKVDLGPNELVHAKKLELIALTATGTNIIDLEYCHKNNIKVCNLRNYASITVAEHAFALMLVIMRQIKGLEEDIGSGLWQKQKIFTMVNRRVFNLYNKKIGIIGKGSIGKQVAKLARAFSMEVEFISAQNLKKPQLHKFLKKQDIITLHCPLNKNTKDLISSKELTIMKKSAVIINTARGGIINELALVNAIKKKIIAGAGIDVTTAEPPKKNHPYYRIIKHSNFVWTPHTAWASEEALQASMDQLILNINEFYLGKPRNLVIK
jgi:glycerate dehydrogenase